MEKLNKLEIDILEKFVEKYSYLEPHILALEVKNRTYTGVGIYVNFSYKYNIDEFSKSQDSLSANITVQFDNLKNPVIVELDISDGKINYLEFVTIGENWNGEYKTFYFVHSDF